MLFTGSHNTLNYQSKIANVCGWVHFMYSKSSLNTQISVKNIQIHYIINLTLTLQITLINYIVWIFHINCTNWFFTQKSHQLKKYFIADWTLSTILIERIMLIKDDTLQKNTVFAQCPDPPWVTIHFLFQI